MISPVEVSACKIPIDAADDWIAAVTKVPTRMPMTGLRKVANRLVNQGSLLNGATAPSIANIPVKRTPKPSRMIPMFFCRSRLADMKKRMPTIIASGARDLGFRSMRKKLSVCRSLRRRMCAVIVVPMFAPMMTPMALRSLRTCALTRPTTMTVVAEEDWMAAVTSAPSATPLITVSVIFSSVRSRRPPDARSRPDASIDMP